MADTAETAQTPARTADPARTAAAPAPLAARRRPSREVRLAVAALAAIAVGFLIVQVVRSLPNEDATVAAGSASSATAVSPSTAAPSTAAPSTAAPSPAGLLATELRNGAATLGPAHGAAAAELATRLRSMADMVERGDGGAGSAATALIVDVVRWRQGGQLDDVATVGAVQLLQKVAGVVVAGSSPTATAGAGSVPEVPTDPGKKKDKDKDDRGD